MQLRPAFVSLGCYRRQLCRRPSALGQKQCVVLRMLNSRPTFDSSVRLLGCWTDRSVGYVLQRPLDYRFGGIRKLTLM